MTNRDGTLITIDGRSALRFERRYPHAIERVWQAVTDPDEMARWFPSSVVGDRAAGSRLVFVDDAQRATAKEAGEPTRAEGPPIEGTVVVHDEPKVFSFTWGGELLRFELHPHGDETVLVFTHVLSHPSVAARNGAGWHSCLGALDNLLGARSTASDATSEDQKLDPMAVYEDYIDRVGPALGSTTGTSGVIWERGTHAPPERVREATTDPAELAAWGAGSHKEEAVRWEVDPVEHGSVYRLVHDGIGRDAALAATWHALLLQLDMWLAAGQLVPVAPDRWTSHYEKVLAHRCPTSR
jgi:uncharacterized protein YndB with AHSA1/START domain